MLILFYRIIINLVLIISPIIIFIRILKKKEHPLRVLEKLGFSSKKRKNGKLIWFHGASVGEIKSVIPLIEKFEKNPEIKQILITSNTLSSLKILDSLKLNKIVHQFFPIDSNLIVNKFLAHWKPNKVIFIDSEIWPNTILRLHDIRVPIILVNARITRKTFLRWSFFSNFSKKIFSKIHTSFSSSRESYNYLKKLKARNILLIGNLKFTQSNNQKNKLKRKLEKYLKTKKIWCASSTHNYEEIICGKVHLDLKKSINNLLTIIIPRHVNRTPYIIKELKKLGLAVHKLSDNEKIHQNCDILLVDSYGKTSSFFSHANHVFIGGSIIKHGGQNPIEPAIMGCNILHGPNIQNFREIYGYLHKHKISEKIKNQFELYVALKKLFNHGNNKNIKKKLMLMGKNILEKTYKEINF